YDKETFEPNFSNETTPFSSEVILVPNPAFGKASVQFDLREKSNVSFHIFDTLGKRVYSSKVENLQAGNNTEWLNLEGLANGLYFVQLAIGGQKITKKLVIGE
ncbi:MAG: T9SS type A sorting domain-containing protein, partial [Saprospiraceae bacterium]